MTKKIVLCLILTLALVLGLTLAWDLLFEATIPIEERPPQRTAYPISPYPAGQPQEGQLVTLYFRFADSTYLSQELRFIEVGLDETIESAIVRALLEGPSADMLDLAGLFASNIELLGTSAQGDILTIVLSDSLLDPPPDAPADYADYPFWQEEIPRRRYLALCSLVNALTEDGRYAQVQLMVAPPGEEQAARRVPRYLFDSVVTDQTLLLEPIGRQEGSILTASGAAQYLLRCWQRKDWMSLYTVLAAGESEALPSQSSFLEEMARIDSSVMSYQTSAGTVRLDGAQATVLVTAQLLESNGDLYRLSEYPMVLRREQGSWKLSYDTLLQFMRAK